MFWLARRAPWRVKQSGVRVVTVVTLLSQQQSESGCSPLSQITGPRLFRSKQIALCKPPTSRATRYLFSPESVGYDLVHMQYM